MRILFQLSGSIAAYKACDAISKLIGSGHEVRTACTASALRFVGRSTLEGLTGHPVFDDPFETGRAMDHISLARWADVLVLAPATAGTINRLAQGLADDAVGALFLAHDFRKPYLVAPAMNHAMYGHPATAASLARLKGWGVTVLPSPEGRQACGETGPGRLLDPEALVSAVLAAAAPAAPGLRILVTSGATREPIDSVRFVTNVSTGRTGAALCDYFSGAGAEVTLVCGTGAARPDRPARIVEYGDFTSLERSLREELASRPYDAVVHAAAVSDYSIAGGAETGKTESSRVGRLELTLTRNHKILDRLKSYLPPSNPLPVIVGFKLTSTPSGEERARAVGSLFAPKEGSPPDYVVHNDLGEMTGPLGHRFTIHSSRGAVSTHDSAPGLAGALLDIFKREVRPA